MSNKTNGTALAQNSNVIDFAAILEQHGRRRAAQDFQELVNQVTRMERQLETAAGEIHSMRRELAELRDLHGQPLHNTCQQSMNTASGRMKEISEKLGGVKSQIVQGARDAVSAIREKGISALDSAASFLGIRKGLESLQQSLEENMQSCDRSVQQVNTIARQYHEVGTATRNFGRAMSGKEIQDDTRQNGRLAKLAAAPYQTVGKLCGSMAKGADAALGRLGQLEQAAQRPSVLENLQTDREEDTQEPPSELEPEQSDSFSIYQIRMGEETWAYRHEPFDRLQNAGLTVDKANYDLVYTAPVTADTDHLEKIFYTFNMNPPEDYRGRSLSVADVVVLEHGGEKTAHYVDDLGFREIPDFLQPLAEPEQTRPQKDSLLQSIKERKQAQASAEKPDKERPPKNNNGPEL